MNLLSLKKMDYEIRAIVEFDLSQIVEMWNEEFSEEYVSSHFTLEEFRKKTVQSCHFDPRGSLVAMNGGEVVGMLISFAKREYENDGYWHMAIAGFIGAVLVRRSFRRQGIAARFLETVVNYNLDAGRPLVLVGGGEGIHGFFPGIPLYRKAAISLFKSQGFSFVRRTCHISRKIGDFSIPPEYLSLKHALEQEGISIEAAAADDVTCYAEFLKNRGESDVERRVAQWRLHPERTILAKHKEQVVGMVGPFHVDESSKRAGYSNIYTLPEFRRKGIGKVMLALGIQQCGRLGGEEMPLWTRPLTHETLYSKLGFKVEVNWDVYAKALPQDMASEKWVGRYLVKGFSR